MALVLTEEQQLLQETAREFVGENLPVTHLRALRDAKDPDGFSRQLWKEMAGLGWTGIVFPEEYGGSALGYAELGIVLEECGRTLAPEPFVSTVLLGGNAVLLGADEQAKKEILTGICKGETVLALAFQERARFRPYDVSTAAEAAGGGFKISGEKVFVLDGHVADHLIVVARTSGRPGDREGLTLFLVPPDAKGVEVQRTFMVDSRNAARVKLDAVEVSKGQVLGGVDGGAKILDAVFDRATIGLASEMVGTINEAFERTMRYLKTRKQFEVVIGSFQALKHRAAHMFCEVELVQSLVLDALRAIDDGRDDVPLMASAAKARASDTASLVTREAIQLHGGIGMTDEEEIGLFLKRAKAAELTLGDSAYHLDRFARLQGF